MRGIACIERETEYENPKKGKKTRGRESERARERERTREGRRQRARIDRRIYA